MPKYYRLPWRSRLAVWTARHLVPNRVHAWIWIAAYQDLDHHYHDVDDHHKDGSRSIYSAVSAFRVENLMRELWRQHLKATVHERP